MKDQNEDMTRIHFEMASFIDKSLLEELTTLVVPHSDSLGMNEQELPVLNPSLQYVMIPLLGFSRVEQPLVTGPEGKN